MRGRWQVEGVGDNERASRFRIGSKNSRLSDWIGCRGSVGRADVGREFGNREAQLSGHLNGTHRVAAKDFGMAINESGAQRECQQQNERDGSQSPVGDRLALALFGIRFWAVPAGVQKTMLEGPVLRQIVPAVVLLFPAVMTEPAHQSGGKCLRIQGSDPEPFVLGGFWLKFATAVMILRKLLFGPHDPNGLRVIGGER